MEEFGGHLDRLPLWICFDGEEARIETGRRPRLSVIDNLDVDVRVIAATNQELEEAVREGRFRADFHDRLSEVTITVPPLRDRMDDVPQLIEHFLEFHAGRHGLPTPRLSPGLVRALARHAWPGNVRELEKAMSRAVIFAQNGWVRAGDLGLPSVPEVVDREGCPALPSRQQEIFRLAALRGSICRRDLTNWLGISGETARRELVALARLGLLRRLGQRRGSQYFAERRIIDPGAVNERCESTQ